MRDVSDTGLVSETLYTFSIQKIDSTQRKYSDDPLYVATHIEMFSVFTLISSHLEAL
jgi:hypothetical protein